MTLRPYGDPYWPYGPPDLEPEPVPDSPRRDWIVWGLVLLLLFALALTCIGLTEAMKPVPSVDQCASM